MGVLGSHHDAEDAAQEAFAALSVCLRDRAPRELRPWLVRVARNAAIDMARRRRENAPADHTMPELSAGGRTMRAELESVLAGIRELPESQRTALLMRELAGHSYREIAVALEVDEGAVRGLIARARIGLRNHREAVELPCATARAALATEPDGRRHGKTLRRHLRGCASCRAYQQALRADARALHSLLPVSAGGAAAGGAVVGGLAAKGAFVGSALTQITAACAVSVCAVGSVVLLSPAVGGQWPRHAALAVGGARLAAPPGRAARSRAIARAAASRGSEASTTSRASRVTFSFTSHRAGGSPPRAGSPASRDARSRSSTRSPPGRARSWSGAGPEIGGRSPGRAPESGDGGPYSDRGGGGSESSASRSRGGGGFDAGHRADSSQPLAAAADAGGSQPRGGAGDGGSHRRDQSSNLVDRSPYRAPVGSDPGRGSSDAGFASSNSGPGAPHRGSGGPYPRAG
jgi:RNA polymerase sigma factor (sigma-70 family)